MRELIFYLYTISVPFRRTLIHFIVDLFSSNGFTNIIVVIDRLIKMRHMILIELINTILVAKCFIRYIFKLHRLLNLIVSDCRS